MGSPIFPECILPVVHTAYCPYQEFGSASPSDTSEAQADRSLDQGRSLPAGAQALLEDPAAAGSKGWGLRTAARASSQPGPSGSEAAEQKRKTLGKSLLAMMHSLSTGQDTKNVLLHYTQIHRKHSQTSVKLQLVELSQKFAKL